MDYPCTCNSHGHTCCPMHPLWLMMLLSDRLLGKDIPAQLRCLYHSPSLHSVVFLGLRLGRDVASKRRGQNDQLCLSNRALRDCPTGGMATAWRVDACPPRPLGANCQCFSARGVLRRCSSSNCFTSRQESQLHACPSQVVARRPERRRIPTGASKSEQILVHKKHWSRGPRDGSHQFEAVAM